MIVDDPADPGAYDAEWIVMLDDWTDGIGTNPQQLYDGLRMPGMSAHDMPDMPGMPGMGTWACRGSADFGEYGDVRLDDQ